MPVFSDRLCLVQPSSGYQIVSHQYALALTFPYLIRFLELDKKFRLSLYVEGRTKQSFSRHLQGEQPYFVLITSNTANFPPCREISADSQERGVLCNPWGNFCQHECRENINELSLF